MSKQQASAENEIEITPEMIAVGLDAYERHRPGEASDFNEERVVCEVYRSMAKAQSEHR